MPDPSAEIWLRMYEEQLRHARHHEELRSQATNLIVVMSGAALALLAAEGASAADSWVLATFIIAINVYGFFMSLKHYERSRHHVSVASKYRAIVSDVCAIGDAKINEVRAAAQKEHFKSFPVLKRVRVYFLWACLHVILISLGMSFIFRSLW
jgi:hypothetical protein